MLSTIPPRVGNEVEITLALILILFYIFVAPTLIHAGVAQW